MITGLGVDIAICLTPPESERILNSFTEADVHRVQFESTIPEYFEPHLNVGRRHDAKKARE